MQLPNTVTFLFINEFHNHLNLHLLPLFLSSSRFLCGTVNDFVAEVGKAYERATENKEEADAMARKVSVCLVCVYVKCACYVRACITLTRRQCRCVCVHKQRQK